MLMYIFDMNIGTKSYHLSGMAGFTASSLTNPIWLVKTRLQLDKASGENTLSVRKCIRNIVREYVSPISLIAVYPQDYGEISFRTMLLRLKSEVEQRVLRNLRFLYPVVTYRVTRPNAFSNFPPTFCLRPGIHASPRPSFQ